MEVRKILLAVAFGLGASACGNNKSANSIFPENQALDSSSCMGKPIQNRFVVQWENGSFSVESADNAEVFKRDFIEPQLESIRFVEFDRQIVLERNDSAIEQGASDSWGQDKIGARSVWSQGVLGQNIKVAVIDSEIDTSHVQLAPRIAINTGEIPNNGVDDDGNGQIDDYYGGKFVSIPSNATSSSGHGTHVAGIIGADPQFGPIEGLAPKAQIIPAQFIANDGGGSLGDAVLAMQYAASRGANIINASWGGAPCVSSLRNAFEELQNRGILVVVAAGNSGRDIDVYPEFPASFNLSNQITVAASSMSDFMTSWSNSGFQLVQVAAPGERILSTTPGNNSAYMDGTSMAAPFVSGTAALLWSAKPQATAQQIRSAILKSVDVYPGREFKVNTRGRINVSRALSLLKQIIP
jgi:subtilisin family serine protease